MNKPLTPYWQSLLDGYVKHLEESECQKDRLIRNRQSLKALAEYCDQNGFDEYTPQIGFAFVEAEKLKNYKGLTTMGYRRAAIRDLNKHLYGQTFWQKRPRSTRKYNTSYVAPVCPKQFSDALEQFLLRLCAAGLKDTTIDNYRRVCTNMLIDFDAQGVKKWEDVDAKTLTSTFLRTSSKEHFVACTRRFFRSLSDTGIISANYSDVLIAPRKTKTIPSVYSEDEIQQLLSCTENITPQGKRDYAIILIAVRLGLRAGDIRDLRFENVDFVNKKVHFVQEKTSVPHQLSLPEEVSLAIRDYIDNGREQSEDPYIFLNGYAEPLSKHFVNQMVARTFEKTDIDYGHRSHGSHALRMTFASQLVGENVPYNVVRALLGQVQIDSTRHYVQFATESLRTCALETPPPSGRFEEYLEKGDEFDGNFFQGRFCKRDV